MQVLLRKRGFVEVIVAFNNFATRSLFTVKFLSIFSLKEGKVALCYAAHSGNVAVLHYLLNQKFDPSLLLLDKTVYIFRCI